MGSFRDAPGRAAPYRLTLMGAFALEGPDGERIELSSKRSRALFALLALAPNADRARSWLEAMLWCDRPLPQAKASLRRELSNLRKQVNAPTAPLLLADTSRVWLDLDQLWVDVRDAPGQSREQFLEGLDIAGEEQFDDWLRQQRQMLQAMEPPAAAQSAPAERHAQPDPLPAKLAIAVLRIRMEPPEPAMDYALDGIGEDLINRLSRLRWLPVIARSSSFALGSEPVDPRTAGIALGARYIVEGIIRQVGTGYRFAVSLIDAESGRTIWSDAIALDAIDDPEAIDAPLRGITAALDHRVDQSEQARAMRDSSSAYQTLLWKARWHLVRLTDEDMERAAELLDQAEALRPASAEVLIEKAWLKVRDLWLHRGSEEDIRGLRRLAQKAIFADPDDARGHMVAGIAEFWLHQPLRAESLLRRSVELNPSLVMALAQLGSALHHTDKRDEAIAVLETARRLSPNDFDLFFTEGELAMAHLGLGNYEQAITHAEASLSRRAAYWSSHVARICALVALERIEAARRAYAELMDAQPTFKPRFIDWLPYSDTSRLASMRAALNRAAPPSD